MPNGQLILSRTLTVHFRRHFRPALLLTILLLALLAWSNRFIQDDAFISFRYADHLVRGDGLVYNAGERVEGYTNFLWTLLIAAGLFLSLDPVAFSQVLGLGCFVLSLVFTYRLARLVLGSRESALLAVVLLGTNYTFSAYATGGLETQLQACLCTVTVWLVVGVILSAEASPGPLMAVSWLTAAGLLTRLDSCVYLLVLFPAVLLTAWRRSPSWRERLSRTASLCLVPLAIVGAWLIWKVDYYGDVLPNTYYVKAGAAGSIGTGLRYCGEFLRSYWLIPVALLALVAVVVKSYALVSETRANRPARRESFGGPSAALCLIGATVLLWLGYVVKVGGDFMEFRFLVPVLPLVFVLVTWLLVRFLEQGLLRAALVASILLGSWYHAGHYQDPGEDIESIGQLHAHVKSPQENWETVGKVLGKLFHDAEHSVVLATTAAGAIPYYSRLETVDMLGLCDPWVARHGVAVEGKPGHQKIATLDYLIRRGVNLVVGHPLVTPRSTSTKELFADRAFPPGSLLLEIPLDDTYKINVPYVVRNDHVDAVIRERGLTTHVLAK